MLDATPYGHDLATRVVTALESGRELGYSHRDYCGMGMALVEGHYCYDELSDGILPLLADIQKPNERGGFYSTQRGEFINWLAVQSDRSLARLEQAMDFYHENQTLSRDRLLEFAQKHERAPLVNVTRWTKLWHAIPAKADIAPWFGTVLVSYSEPHRHYHNLKHLNECLTEFDGITAQAHDPIALEYALWFHDVIYDVAEMNNEDISAEWARDSLESADVSKPFIKQVRSLILATKTHTPDRTPDAALMCDIDLAILGQNKARFAEYEEGIRQEYIDVPIRKYAKKRAEILQRFLERETIYCTDSFQQRYETKARMNLKVSIDKLR